MFKKIKTICPKLVIYISAFVLVFNAPMISVFFNAPNTQLRAEDMCEVAVDVILVIDISGSMAEGETPSKCEWPEMKPYNGGSTWFLNTKYNVSEDWCQNTRNSFDESDPVFQYIPLNYTPTSQSKINSAKDAASSFLNNMGSNDQSSLVSFSDNATLVKGLDDDHSGTQTAVNDLTTGGSTNIGEAINFAAQELDQHQNGQAVKAMILLTDGKANKPNGDGLNENTDDVQYAIDEAILAAAENYKIFTVGLGSNGEINETMLQQIASDTNANYHHAPNGTDLSDIYNNIAYEICQYGSISGCKYNDLNNNKTIDQNEPTVNGWIVNLNNGSSTTTQTVADGCYTFAGLSDHTYTVSETIQPGWIQTYPPEGEYTVEILNHNDVENIDFANYFPTCGNDILDSGEQCDDGNLDDGDGCSAICENEIPDPTCGDGNLDPGESCDNGPTNGDHAICSDQCTLNPQCNDGIDNDDDQLIDYSDDPGCDDSLDDNETNGEGIQSGDIVINEIIQNPNAVWDSDGEWFELYNTTDHSIDLNGCIVSENGSQSFVINSTLNILSNGYAVLADKIDPLENGGVNADYEYSSITLNNSDDELILTCDQTEIDRVEYDGGPNFPDPNGKSMILSNPNVDNNVGSNWCESSSPFGDGDLGTPGSQNDSCGGPVCDSSISGSKYQGQNKLPGWTIQLFDSQDLNTPVASEITDQNGAYYFNNLCNGTYIIKEVQQTGWQQIFPTSPTYYTVVAENNAHIDKDFSNTYIGACGNGILDDGEQCDDNNTNDGDGCSAICQSEVVINELMWPGSATSTADEWLELKNLTQSSVDLSACKITKNGSDMIADLSSQSILSNGYFLISNWDKDMSVIDIDPDVVDTSVGLNNSDVQYKLICNDTTIDTADDGSGAPLAGVLKEDGFYNRSMSRKSTPGDGTLEANWCDAGTKTNLDSGGDDYATPGAVNVCKEDIENPGSIKLCKYEDEDGNTDTSNDQTPVVDWVFEIFDGSATSTATTTELGCTTFEELVPGDYVVSEVIQNSWYLLNNYVQYHTFNIVAGQQTQIDFFNTEYSTISGYKYEDEDGIATTTDDWTPLGDWVINLFDSSSTSTPISTLNTNSLGYFEFTSLIPGDYTVTEELQDSWLALFPTSTSLTLLSGTATSTYFVNYFEGGSGGSEEYCGDGIKNNDEQCDDSDGLTSGYYCTNSCTLEKESSGGGGGGFTQRPEATLELIYPFDKYLYEEYYETIVVSNSGNIILNNGVLSIDLPEDKLKFISAEPAWHSITTTGLATWDIPTLTVNDTFLVKIIIETLSDGEAITDVSAVFDQTTSIGTMTENIIFVGGTGGGPEKEEVVVPETPTSPPAGPSEGTVAGTGETTEPETEPEEEFVPQVKGEQVYEIKNGGEGCSECTWWHWLLIIIFLAGLNFVYYFMLREEK
jgi:cysteine-rich repeat protein